MGSSEQTRVHTETCPSVIRGEAGRPVRSLTLCAGLVEASLRSSVINHEACNWRNSEAHSQLLRLSVSYDTVIFVLRTYHLSRNISFPRYLFQLSDHSRLRTKLYRTVETYTQHFRYDLVSKHIPTMKLPAYSTLVAFFALATPSTAGLLSCLLPYGLGDYTLYTPLLDHIPAAVMGLRTILAFPACAHNCLVTVPCNCGMVDYGCRCKDPLHIFAQSLCVVENCPNDRDQAIAYNAWANTCAPYLGITIEK